MVENIGASPIDPTTLAGKVRTLVGDTKATPYDPDVPGFGEYAWYSDAELEALGSMNSDNPKRVAVWVLSIVPLNQAMLLKKWTDDDLAVDGPAIIAAMEATLKRLSAEIDKEADMLGDDEFFGIYGGNYRSPHYPFVGTTGWWRVG